MIILDLSDSILMAEVSAAEPLIQRLDPRVFRTGIVVFSDNAQAEHATAGVIQVWIPAIDPIE